MLKMGKNATMTIRQKMGTIMDYDDYDYAIEENDVANEGRKRCHDQNDDDDSDDKNDLDDDIVGRYVGIG